MTVWKNVLQIDVNAGLKINYVIMCKYVTLDITAEKPVKINKYFCKL